MAKNRHWSSTEDAVLWTYAERFGTDWLGFPEVLPDRSHVAIVQRYRTLKAERDRGRHGDIARMTMRCLKYAHEGLPPSKIDRMMGWPPGRAHDMIVSAWADDQ